MAKRARSPCPAAQRSEKRRVTTRSTTQANAGGQSSTGADIQMSDTPSQLQTTRPPLPATSARIGPALQKKILLAAKSTPRYLFRVWRGQEDTKVAESDEAIVPAAFNVHDAPQSMFDVPKKVLVTHMKSNLRGHQKPSLFSDWTHSFHAAIEKAGELHNSAGGSATQDDSVFLCVLDTRALPEHVTVLHTSHLGLLDKWIPKISTVAHKFLAYGIVPVAAFKAVRYGDSLDGKPTWLNSSAEDFGDFENEVELAVEFGQAFGGQFELPVVATCVAMYKHRADVLVDSTWKAKVAESLCKIYEVPVEWEADPLITTDAACMVGYKDAMRCRAHMRAMVQRKPCRNNRAGRSRPRTASVSQLAEMLESETIGDAEDEDEDGNEDFVPREDSDSDRLSDDGEVEDSPMRLPRGVMDETTKRQLQQAAMHTPRYLFRAWSDTAPRFGAYVVSPSGGYVGLNTVKAITPLAFDKRRGCGKASIYEHTRASLTNMALLHLHGSRDSVSTEFSSWDASLQVAFRFAAGKRDAHISVIDTTKLPKRNVVLHVPSLQFLGADFNGYDWEYLAHGVITGPTLNAVPLSAFANIGLPQQLGVRALPLASPCSSKGSRAITKAEVKQARKVADKYGPQFRVAVTLAILCLKQRCGDFWDCGNIKSLQVIADGLQDCKIPQHWCKDKSIFTDVVHTTGYGEIKQMIYLLRALVDYCHGKGARGRSRSRARSVSRPNRYVRARSVARRRGKKSVRFADRVEDGGGDEERGRGRKLTRPLEEVRYFSAEDKIR